MTLYASFSDVRIVSGRVTIPEAGLWSADLSLASEGELATTATLKIGDLEMVGSVFRSTPFAGSRHVRLVGGKGGWGKSVAAQAYENPAGVLASLVLRDVANAVGESVQVDADSSVGTAFVREAGPSGRILRQLGGDRWWVDPAGVTRVGTRDKAGTAIASEVLVSRFDGGLGLAEIATEHLSDWTPGRTFASHTITSPQTIATVSLEMRAEGKLRVVVLTRAAGTAATARLVAGFRALLRDADPRRTFSNVYEYAVQDSDGTTASLAVVDTTQPVPDLVAVPLRGMAVTPTVGSLCLVVFVNGDPTRPAVISVDPVCKDAALDATELLEVGKDCPITRIAGGTPVVQGIARVGDAVIAGPFGGTIVEGSLKAACGG